MDEQLRWLGSHGQADPVRAQQANPAEPGAQGRERPPCRGSELNALPWEAAPDGSPAGAPWHEGLRALQREPPRLSLTLPAFEAPLKGIVNRTFRQPSLSSTHAFSTHPYRRNP